ncbi:hypothetical protein ANCCAN_14144 [Ancylostoma caninum]|uniref:PEGA domain-containing protein n=1 Tax=Ancylostoma caninum TaxID=29170 RepID=A0A368G666_ANCCA|nr:hypothetical protein ANCCAN_14144 [Ancylostoma caninum]
MPDGEQLPQLWEDNKKALMEYMFAVHSGIKGLVSDAVTGEPIEGAVVWIRNGTDKLPIRHPVTSWLLGDYYRILPAGKYEVLVHAEGYEPATRNVTVTNTVRDSAMVVDFTLKPLIAEQPTVSIERGKERDQRPELKGHHSWRPLCKQNTCKIMARLVFSHT